MANKFKNIFTGNVWIEVVLYLRLNPEIQIIKIAKGIDRQYSMVHYVIQCLESKGVVMVDKRGREVLCQLTLVGIDMAKKLNEINMMVGGDLCRQIQ